MKNNNLVQLIAFAILMIFCLSCKTGSGVVTANQTHDTVASKPPLLANERVYLKQKYTRRLKDFVGKYAFKQGFIDITLKENQLYGQPSKENYAAALTQVGELEFEVKGHGARVIFTKEKKVISGLILRIKETDLIAKKQ